MKRKSLLILLVIMLALCNISFAYGDTAYVVKDGDVLWRIAKDFNMTYQELAKYNSIANPNLIFKGQVLKIPVSGSAPAHQNNGSSTVGSRVDIGNADIILKNGTIYTVDPDRTTAQALAVKGNQIIYVGTEKGADQYFGTGTKVIDLQGGMALPGFIDSHAHPAASANELFTLDLSDCKTKEEYLTAVSDYYHKNKDIAAIIGFGWNMPVFSNGAPNKQMLDEISPDIPILLSDSGYHLKWMNSKALAMAGISKETKVPEGALVEKDVQGEPTGLVSDYPGVGELFNNFTKAQYEEAIKYYQDQAHQSGITTTFEDLPRNVSDGIAAYRDLEKNNELALRIAFYMRVRPEDDINTKVSEIKNVHQNNKSGLFRVNGVKIFIDGVLEGKTAYLEKPYLVDPTSVGNYMWEGKTDKLDALCALADKNGLALHFHAIGDAAVRTALDAVEFARTQNGQSDDRPGITHVQLVNQSDFNRFKKLGVTAVPQPFWAVYDEYYDQAVEYVGKERADKQYPIESFYKAGVLLASGSDYPVQTSRPLVAIESGVTRAYPGEPLDGKFLPEASEKATLAQMIESYTINGAYANFLEKEVGSLEIGKKADIVILDKNLFDLPANQIAEAKEMMTIFNGKVVYENK
jgi:Predicted metal-dependent hydrolase with the TIM-barrel fold